MQQSITFINMKVLSILLSITLAVLTLAGAELAKSSLFQIRLIQDSAQADTEEMIITHSIKDQKRTVQEIVHVQKAPLLDQVAVASASVQKNVITGNPQIEVAFTKEGRKLFAEVTRQNVGRRLAIVVNGCLLASPKIMTEISGGKALISGRFSEQEAAKLAAKINVAVKR